MDSIEFRLSQRRQWLRRGWIATVVFLIGVAGVAVAPEVSGNATGFLAIPGLVGLIVAIISFNVAHGRTVLSPRGIRTGTLFGHHSCHWSEVAEIESVNFSVSRYSLPTEVPEGHGQAQIRIRRSSGKSFKLAAPRDLNGPDPQLKAKFEEIRDYWANTRQAESQLAVARTSQETPMPSAVVMSWIACSSAGLTCIPPSRWAAATLLATVSTKRW